jgi:NTE family protein
MRYLLFILLFICLAFCVNAQDVDSLKIGLVLGGGGARGFAHVGVLKVLEEMKIYPDYIVGTSIGSIIGALYSCGYTAAEIEVLARTINWEELFTPMAHRRHHQFAAQRLERMKPLFEIRFQEGFDVSFPTSLISNQRISQVYTYLTLPSEFKAGKDFDNLAIPYRAVATDLRTGREVDIPEGSISTAMMASSAIPLVFPPVRYKDYILVDGGIVNNVPVDIAKRAGMGRNIAVDVASQIKEIESVSDPMSLVNQTVGILMIRSNKINEDDVDLFIQPALKSISSADFNDRAVDSLIAYGYRAADSLRDEMSDFPKRLPTVRSYLPKAILAINEVVIEDIKISGLENVRKELVYDELEFEKGDKWDYEKVARSLDNLYYTESFQNVTFSLEQIYEDRVRLIIQVEERLNKVISFGANYNSETEASGFVQIRNDNWLGGGEILTATFLAGETERGGIFQIKNSGLTSRNFAVCNEFYFLREETPLYEGGSRLTFGKYLRIGLNLNAGFQLKKWGLVSVGLKKERLNISENEFGDIPEQSYGIGSFMIRGFINTKDDEVYPTKGFKYSALLEQALVRLGGDLDYRKFSFNFERYFTIEENTIALVGNGGFSNLFLPTFNRYNLGGVEDLPGYNLNQYWGNQKVVFGVNYRREIYSGLHAMGRFRIGKLWDKLSDFSVSDMKYGVSAGLSLSTPLGPLNLDYGYGGNGNSELYFSVGK